MHVKNKQPLPAVTLAAIGVVYGDIGHQPAVYPARMPDGGGGHHPDAGPRFTAFYR
ncbi:hypothetical protein ACMHYR_10170 [Serratia marcescens]|uniref:hypothetical protein n=1 Tax=Serratia marcescens TaxID=615 RepID=UPI0039EA2501